MPDKYDKQLIVAFLHGDSSGAIQRAISALNAKAKGRSLTSSSVEIRISGDEKLSDDPSKSLRDGLSTLTGKSRLYIAGHGNQVVGKVGGWSGEEMASLLKECGLQQAALISVTGCRTATIPASNLDDYALQSFAESFHRALGSGNPAVRCDLYARVFNVVTINDKYKEKFPHMIGRKTTILQQGNGRKGLSYKGMDSYVSKQTDSKRHYFWHDDAQKSKWVAYNPANVTSYDSVSPTLED